VVVWAGIIFLFSATPSLGTGWGIWDTLLRKSAHIGEFAVLFLLVARAIRLHGFSNMNATLSGMGIALVYAVSDEYHQSFVPGRSAAVIDVLFDLAGILIAAALVLLYKGLPISGGK